MKRIVWLVLAMALWAGVVVAQTAPLEFMRGHVGKIIEILKDPAYKAQDRRVERMKLVRGEVDQIFDWVELSRRTLAQKWNDLSTEQRREFVSLYADLLEKTYRDRIDAYENQQVLFLKERSLDADKTEVLSVLKTGDKEIPIDYRLRQDKGQWRVYDVSVEGISLIQNYRKQFGEILAQNTPDQMLAILRDKVKQQSVQP